MRRKITVGVLILLFCIGAIFFKSEEKTEIAIHGVCFKNLDQAETKLTTFEATGKECGKKFIGDVCFLFENEKERIELNNVLIDSSVGMEYSYIRSNSNPAIDNNAKLYGLLLGNMEARSFAIILYQDDQSGWQSNNVEVYCFPAKNREEAVLLMKEISSGISWLKDVCWG